MRVLIDTNILFSALLFPQSTPSKAVFHAVNNHDVVLCDRNISELKEILLRKAPDFLPNAEIFLAELSTSSFLL